MGHNVYDIWTKLWLMIQKTVKLNLVVIIFSMIWNMITFQEKM
jgi:hypothetical protein